MNEALASAKRILEATAYVGEQLKKRNAKSDDKEMKDLSRFQTALLKEARRQVCERTGQKHVTAEQLARLDAYVEGYMHGWMSKDWDIFNDITEIKVSDEATLVVDIIVPSSN